MQTIISDIKTEKDIKFLVSAFYQKAFGIPTLYSAPETAETMRFACYHFWKSILLDSKPYIKHPLLAFALYPLPSNHAGQWIHVFYQTIDEYFNGSNADKAKAIAANIARQLEKSKSNQPLEWIALR